MTTLLPARRSAADEERTSCSEDECGVVGCGTDRRRERVAVAVAGTDMPTLAPGWACRCVNPRTGAEVRAPRGCRRCRGEGEAAGRAVPSAMAEVSRQCVVQDGDGAGVLACRPARAAPRPEDANRRPGVEVRRRAGWRGTKGWRRASGPGRARTARPWGRRGRGAVTRASASPCAAGSGQRAAVPARRRHRVRCMRCTEPRDWAAGSTVDLSDGRARATPCQTARARRAPALRRRGPARRPSPVDEKRTARNVQRMLLGYRSHAFRPPPAALVRGHAAMAGTLARGAAGAKQGSRDPDQPALGACQTTGSH